MKTKQRQPAEESEFQHSLSEKQYWKRSADVVRKLETDTLHEVPLDIKAVKKLLNEVPHDKVITALVN